jgi:hypothetical protein
VLNIMDILTWPHHQIPQLVETELKKINEKYIATGLAVGFAIGTIMSSVTDDSTWIGIGLIFGVVFGAALGWRYREK